MKTIINGKIYDTDTAERIAKGPCVSVYRTQSGKWFKRALSVFSNNYEIKLISFYEAKELVGLHAPDQYEKYFGQAEEA